MKSSGKLSHAVKQPTDEKMERVASDAAHGAAGARGGTTVVRLPEGELRMGGDDDAGPRISDRCDVSRAAAQDWEALKE